MITYWTWSGATPERSSAALMANPPRSAPEKSFSEPSSRPIGVRAPLTMTDPAIPVVLLGEPADGRAPPLPGHFTVTSRRRAPDCEPRHGRLARKRLGLPR